MGIEFTLRVEGASAAELDQILRQLPCFSGLDRCGLHVFAVADHQPDDMPDAHGSVQNGEIYYCDNGCNGQGQAILDALVAHLCSRYERVVVEEL